jgi:hypothetical protein
MNNQKLGPILLMYACPFTVSMFISGVWVTIIAVCFWAISFMIVEIGNFIKIILSKYH